MKRPLGSKHPLPPNEQFERRLLEFLNQDTINQLRAEIFSCWSNGCSVLCLVEICERAGLTTVEDELIEMRMLDSIQDSFEQ